MNNRVVIVSMGKSQGMGDGADRADRICAVARIRHGDTGGAAVRTGEYALGISLGVARQPPADAAAGSASIAYLQLRHGAVAAGHALPGTGQLVASFTLTDLLRKQAQDFKHQGCPDQGRVTGNRFVRIGFRGHDFVSE